MQISLKVSICPSRGNAAQIHGRAPGSADISNISDDIEEEFGLALTLIGVVGKTCS
jgi:hypothetical protein